MRVTYACVRFRAYVCANVYVRKGVRKIFPVGAKRLEYGGTSPGIDCESNTQYCTQCVRVCTCSPLRLDSCVLMKCTRDSVREKCGVAATRGFSRQLYTANTLNRK